MEIRYTNPTCDGWPPPPVSRLLDGFFLHELCWYNVWAEGGRIKWESGFEAWPATLFASGTVEGALMGFQVVGRGNHEHSLGWCTEEKLQEVIKDFALRGRDKIYITKSLRPA
jgi:hypothetical protein